jgi:hypothetical protein
MGTDVGGGRGRRELGLRVAPPRQVRWGAVCPRLSGLHGWYPGAYIYIYIHIAIYQSLAAARLVLPPHTHTNTHTHTHTCIYTDIPKSSGCSLGSPLSINSCKSWDSCPSPPPKKKGVIRGLLHKQKRQQRRPNTQAKDLHQGAPRCAARTADAVPSCVGMYMYLWKCIYSVFVCIYMYTYTQKQVLARCALQCMCVYVCICVYMCIYTYKISTVYMHMY